MTCPDIARLLDLVLEDEVDPEIGAHVRECLECGATIRFVREVRAGYAMELPVSDASFDRALHTVQAAIAAGRDGVDPTPWDLAAMVGLGAATSVVILGGTGSVGELGWPVFLIVLLSGAAAAVYEYGQSRVLRTE